MFHHFTSSPLNLPVHFVWFRFVYIIYWWHSLYIGFAILRCVYDTGCVSKNAPIRRELQFFGVAVFVVVRFYRHTLYNIISLDMYKILLKYLTVLYANWFLCAPLSLVYEQLIWLGYISDDVVVCLFVFPCMNASFLAVKKLCFLLYIYVDIRCYWFVDIIVSIHRASVKTRRYDESCSFLRSCTVKTSRKLDRSRPRTVDYYAPPENVSVTLTFELMTLKT